MALEEVVNLKPLKYYLKCPKIVYCTCPNAWNTGRQLSHSIVSERFPTPISFV